MMKTYRYIISAAVAVLMTTVVARAQEYSFAIPRAEVVVTIEPEGSALINYKLIFFCNRGAHAIDIVDIGMPTSKHRPVSAAISGRPLAKSSIKKSTYIDNGYEIHLGSGAIPPESTGVFEFTGRSSGMVWQDTTDAALASFRFTPTWFGSQYVKGTTDLILRFRLPPGDYPEPDRTILRHKNTPEFQLKGVMEGDTVPSVVWRQKVRMTGENMFGVSFPKAYVTNVKKTTVLDLFVKWFKGNLTVQLWSGGVVLLLLGGLFFWATRGTGWVLGWFLIIVALFAMCKSAVIHLWMYPVLLLGLILVLIFRHAGKRHYIRADIAREGSKVNSRLSAVEGAIVLDLPINKVLTILIFELMRKGHITITCHVPLMLKVVSTYSSMNRRILESGRVVSVTKYEGVFLDQLAEHPQVSVEKINFEKTMTKLIDQVKTLLVNCDIKRTREYCQYRVDQMWRNIKTEKDFTVRNKFADQNVGWLVADEKYKERLSELLSEDGYRYSPGWHNYPHHSPSPTGTLGVGTAPIDAPAFDTPAFTDITDSIFGRLEKIGDSMSSIPLNQSNSIDLSGLDQLSHTVIEALSESSGSGGGGHGGGGCACACAGCACACACAGGGR